MRSGLIWRFATARWKNMARVQQLFFFIRWFPNNAIPAIRTILPAASLSVALLAIPAFATQPDYLHTAFANFSPEVPSRWAYTLTTERDGKQIVERFNPAKPPTEQWTLLRMEGHAATAEDTEKYFKYKASQAPGAVQATFHKNDIEPGTLKLLREDALHAEYTCAFREQSANADKMLGHLQLVLSINKQLACIENFRLVLNAPYSPVLTVKMTELVVTTEFSPPQNGQPGLPARGSSHFKGRIFLIRFEENISYQYSDFAPAG